jgi:TRAP transporter TAXI family solute receptor
MALYIDRVQVVIRREASIERLRDLRGKRIFVGADGSGTKVIATKILATVELDDSDGGYDRADPATVTSFRDASSMLRDDELDAAFFVSSTPAAAVWDALDDSCCTLLDLPAASLEEAVPGLTRQQIPARSYPNQPDAKTTVGANALLIGREDLRDEVVEDILNSLADHLDGLSLANIRVQGARNATAFDERSLGGIALHPGAEKFRAGRLFAEPPISQQ